MGSKFVIDESLSARFQQAATNFYLDKGRSFDWRKTTDRFRILVAEVLLKLTGARKAEPVYHELMKKYGTPRKMAKADKTELEDMFLPLGLTNRAGLLINISSTLVDSFSGEVPDDFKTLTGLKGVGRYTANAILCLGYGRKVPLVDESIRRIFVRCLGFRSNKPAHSDKDIWSIAERMLPDSRTKEYNLGLIDIGASFCRHSRFYCADCPLNFLRRKKIISIISPEI
jgi:A/G-specific adenine glycosylase